MGKQAWIHSKASRQARGYGREWQGLRLRVLKRDAHTCQCARCKASGVLRPATEVDHVISKANWQRTRGSLAGVDALTNLQAINRDCHLIKSIEERGRRAAVKVGDDGFPVEEHHDGAFWCAPGENAPSGGDSEG